MNHSQYHYKGMDPDLDEYLSEYKNQTPLETDDHYAGKPSSIICMQLLALFSSPFPSSFFLLPREQLCNHFKL
jgi:hypothetical protein